MDGVERAGKPERPKKNDGRRLEDGGRSTRKAPEMGQTVSGLNTKSVIGRVSKTVMPVRVTTTQVPSEAMVVFAIEEFASQAVLYSTMHQHWTIKYGSEMRNDPRYTPSDIFETLPRPAPTNRLK